MKAFLEKFGFWGLILLVALSGSMLVFDDLMDDIGGFLKTDIQKIDRSGQMLKVAYLFKPIDLNPFSQDVSNRSRLVDVYEPLVGLDQNLAAQPVLAVTYGLRTDTEWQFKLRKGVKFHDLTDFDIEDVKYSLEMAKNSESMANLTDEISTIESLDEDTLLIKTEKPDPLFLNKLSKLLIVPNGFVDYDKPIGTGPYKIINSDNLGQIVYQRFEEYWSNLPYFEKAEIVSIPGKNDRVESLINQNIDFLVNVPPDAVAELRERGISIATIPSLEVGFAMFNFKDEHFANKNFRLAVAKVLNKTAFLDLAFGFAKTLNQFVSNGVFGYNPDLKGIEFDLTSAEKEFSSIATTFEKIKIKFYYPENLKLLGQYFKEQLAQIGFDTELIALNDLDLQQKLKASELGFYYLGWRHDSGDAIGFLRDILHTQKNGYGELNGMNYSNSQVDSLIEKSEINFDVQSRLHDMQEVMRIVVEEDVVGVPLFETESIFAFSSDLIFQPRVDSQVFLSKITK